MKAVIIDDEQGAINALKLLIGKHAQHVEIVLDTTDCNAGIEAIDQYHPEIVFLDVSMPDMSGFTLLDKISYKDFSLVFTTAHERYAIQALRHKATDYLVKPIDIDELKNAVERAGKQRVLEQPGTGAKRLEPESRISLPIREGVIYLRVSDITWIASDGNYSTFYTADGKSYLVSKNIGEYEDVLPLNLFFRAHKSHLINIRRVKKYIRTDGYFVEMENGSVLEISRRRKDEFLMQMGKVH